MANIISVIKYEGDNDIFIYKHPETDFNIGSQLIVHESQEAVLFRDGMALESFGPGRHTLDSKNIVFLRKQIESLAGGESVFHCEIYFINLVTQLGIKWGTDSKIRMFDPISGLHVEVGAFGVFNIKIIDGRKLLLKVVGTSNELKQNKLFGVGDALGLLRGIIVSKVKNSLAKAIRENDLNILEIDEHIDELSLILKSVINDFLKDYGLEMPEFYITNISTPDDDPNFIKLKQQHAERYLRVQQQRILEAEAIASTSRAEAEAMLKLAISKGDANAEAEARKIIAKAEAEEIRIKGQAEAEMLKLKGGTYAGETARVVGEAIAKGSSGGSIASEIVKAGIGAGVGVGIAKDVVDSVKDNTDIWTCPNCGRTKLVDNFCPTCGHKRGEKDEK